MALTSLKFHLSLNVSNLARSVAFYRVFFGEEPAKLHDDYAKFELVEPPVVFSLVPQPALAGGSISRIALCLPDAALVAVARQRLEAAGIPTQAPTSGDPQRKFYAADPDLNYWEVYTGEDEAPAAPPLPPVRVTAANPVVWEHFVSQPTPERIPHAEHTLDEVRLTGTFNSRLDEQACANLVREAFRVLRPGGKVLVHGLVGDRPFPGAQPQLPGLASLVARVPVQTEPVQSLRAAGFTGTQFVKFSEKPWFTIDGVELREVKLIAWKPGAGAEMRHVVYRGPFRQAVDDAGTVYPRGQKVAVATPTWDLLQKGAAAEQFLFIKPAGTPAGSCG
jgi:catechol 2,3-dioxygenase-like lactoylglutathione lyase family enzyme